MEKFSIQNGVDGVKGIYSGLQKRISAAVTHVFDAFKEPTLMLVPSEERLSSRETVEDFCSRRGVRGIFSQGDHDELFASLREYNFSDAVIKETRTGLKAYTFWAHDLDELSPVSDTLSRGGSVPARSTLYTHSD